MSQSVLVRLAGTGKDILDVGCATGYTGRALIKRGNRVWGVELDGEAAAVAREELEDVVVADLEEVELAAAFPSQQFDAVIFGDVLEHLRDPGRALAQAKSVLAPGGEILISIPNVGHGALRLSLLAGRWDYTDTGLLDRTHVTFFTPETFEQLLRQMDLEVLESQPVELDLFNTEIKLDLDSFPPGLVEWMYAQPHALAYQTVYRTAISTPETRQAAAEWLTTAVERETTRLRRNMARSTVAMHVAQSAAQESQAAAAAATEQVQAIKASRSYRLLNPVRRLVHAVRRDGRSVGSMPATG
jgi:SAM-dependent methyltransferase